jgi:hypothetical protein
MTKKDYERMALIIRALRDDTYKQYNDNPNEAEALFIKGMGRGIDKVMSHLADYLEEDNPRFDHVKFFTACGYPIEEWV